MFKLRGDILPFNPFVMQSYFSEMYSFFINVIKYKDYIDTIYLENTANFSKQFKNIVINVHLNTYKKLYRVLTLSFEDLDIKKDELEDLRELEKIQEKLTHFVFPHNYYKLECSSWYDLVITAESMYSDILQTLSNNDLSIKTEFNILGYDNDEDPNFYKIKTSAREMDVAELLKVRFGIKQENSLEMIENKLNNIEKTYNYLYLKFMDIETAIKKQKNAYILSKLADNKTTRKQYIDNKKLIDAYDAYVDVKKILSKHPYK